MSRSLAAPRPLTNLFTALLAAFGLLLASLSILPSAAAATDDATQTVQPDLLEDDATQTAEPNLLDNDATQTADPAPVEDAESSTDSAASTEAPAEALASAPSRADFLVEYTGPGCWDSSYNVYVEHDGGASSLRLALQEEVDGSWVTLITERFYEGTAFVFSDELAEGETATFQVVVYDRRSPTEQTLLHGPITVTGVSTADCDEWEVPSLPEDQWTVVEAGCGSLTFTSRADQDVVVVWMGEDDLDIEENYFFLAPGQSQAINTTDDLVYWVSAAGVGDDLQPIEDEIYLAGQGEVEIRQDCAPDQPGQPGDGDHKIPGKVQTDGGANTATLALGLVLMALAGVPLARRTV